MSNANTADAEMKTSRRRLWLPEMEGVMARWYDRQRGTVSNIKTFRDEAARLTNGLKPGATVLEVAPGPGYFAIEVARLGFRVTGLDISRTMVEIATGHARDAGVSVDFRRGDAAAMPFEAGTFDLIVCQAAFKNFRAPVEALNEMHRVLRFGASTVIQDLRKDASIAEVQEEVRRQSLSGINALITTQVLAGLRRRAYTRAQFEDLIAQTAFRSGTLTTTGIGIEVRLTREPAPEQPGR